MMFRCCIGLVCALLVVSSGALPHNDYDVYNIKSHEEKRVAEPFAIPPNQKDSITGLAEISWKVAFDSPRFKLNAYTPVPIQEVWSASDSGWSSGYLSLAFGRAEIKGKQTVTTVGSDNGFTSSMLGQFSNVTMATSEITTGEYLRKLDMIIISTYNESIVSTTINGHMLLRSNGQFPFADLELSGNSRTSYITNGTSNFSKKATVRLTVGGQGTVSNGLMSKGNICCSVNGTVNYDNEYNIMDVVYMTHLLVLSELCQLN